MNSRLLTDQPRLRSSRLIPWIIVLLQFHLPLAPSRVQGQQGPLAGLRVPPENIGFVGTSLLLPAI